MGDVAGTEGRGTTQVGVLLPLPMGQCFTYTTDRALCIGQCVRVSFGKKILWGVVWDMTPQKHASAKPILQVFDGFILSDALRTWMSWVSFYAMVPLGQVLRMVIPEGIPTRKTNKNEETACANTFTEKTRASLSLSSEQACAATYLLEHTQKRVFSTHLLEGVTGSGKTEVCLRLCEDVWRDEKSQVLILVPEIALAQQWKQRIAHYFHLSVEHWHAGSARRKETFSEIVSGRARVIVGARSALFLPYPHLRLIVVDEEHEMAYKQEESPLYHARDMAVSRAQKEGLPIVLMSATPSLETLRNVQRERYGRIRLSQRYKSASVPALKVIPMGAKKEWLSAELFQALTDTLERGQQGLLFLNRRGHAALLFCGKCGYRASCQFCSAWLGVHQKNPDARDWHLLCHHCGFLGSLPKACPHCQSTDGMISFGPGVEKIAEEVAVLFPKARVAIFSSDHLSSPKRLEALITSIRQKEVDIIVGTQMIAKGHHFPDLTCIGIVDVDGGLCDPDIRASERMFQLLTQISGRAGRESLPGTVYLQTRWPEHNLIQHLLAGTSEQFIQEELESRERNGWPPYSRLAALIISGLCEKKVSESAQLLLRSAPRASGLTVLGPAPAVMNPLRGRFRWRFLVKAGRMFPVQNVISAWLTRTEIPSTVRVQVDIDPQSFH